MWDIVYMQASTTVYNIYTLIFGFAGAAGTAIGKSVIDNYLYIYTRLLGNLQSATAGAVSLELNSAN